MKKATGIVVTQQGWVDEASDSLIEETNEEGELEENFDDHEDDPTAQGSEDDEESMNEKFDDEEDGYF